MRPFAASPERARACCGLVLALLLALSGCAQAPATPEGPSRRPQLAVLEVPGPPGLNEDSCARNDMLSSAERKTTTEQVLTDRVHRFIDSAPTEVVRGLDSVSLEGLKLRVFGSARGRFDEFSGPVVETIESTRFEASPGIAVIAHTLTLGIGLLAAPVKSAQHAFGCVDRRLLRREVKLEDSRPTGRFEWRELATHLMLRIEGLGAPIDLTLAQAPAGAAGGQLIDLTQQVLQHPTGGPLPLRVRCLNCATPGTARPPETAHLREELSFSADFSSARAAELARLEREAERARLERERREREAAALQAFRTALLGRWSTRDTCVNELRDDVGTHYEAASPNAPIRMRTVTFEAGTSVTRASADRVDLRLVDLEAGLFEAQLTVLNPATRRTLTRSMRVRIADERMAFDAWSEDSRALIRAGLRVVDGRPAEPLFNCAHPSMLAARAQAQWLKAEQVRIAEEERLRREREAAEKRRLVEEERLRAEREAVERRRIEEERRRRQEI